LTGIRFALDSDWENAVICILVAACFDMIDGLSARLLRAFSRFGAELDSLADAISFGVAPSIISFLWIKSSLMIDKNSEILGWYWIPFLFYTMCCAFRLARFNVMAQENSNNLSKKGYFTGVPSPAGAGLVLLPLGFSFICERFKLDFEILDYSSLLLFWVSFISVLLISQIPTFSFRNIRLSVSSRKALVVLLVVCLFVAIFIKEMWLSLFAVGTFYLCSIPVSFVTYKRDLQKSDN
jgi:CDP-diacylglycerol--serine O-phosphatidyltransferase